MEKYLEPCTEEDGKYEYDGCIFKLNKQKYENNVDKDYPGLRKLIDTLKIYYEKINYQKIYSFPESKTVSCSSESEYETEDESDSEREDYFSKEELKKYLYFKEGLDSDSLCTAAPHLKKIGKERL